MRHLKYEFVVPIIALALMIFFASAILIAREYDRFYFRFTTFTAIIVEAFRDGNSIRLLEMASKNKSAEKRNIVNRSVADALVFAKSLGHFKRIGVGDCESWYTFIWPSGHILPGALLDNYHCVFVVEYAGGSIEVVSTQTKVDSNWVLTDFFLKS